MGPQRSWWSDWGTTSEVENCISPFPPLPIVPIPEPEPTHSSAQPRISDFEILEASIVQIYFITYGDY
jgi:hypothetical protein